MMMMMMMMMIITIIIIIITHLVILHYVRIYRVHMGNVKKTLAPKDLMFPNMPEVFRIVFSMI